MDSSGATGERKREAGRKKRFEEMHSQQFNDVLSHAGNVSMFSGQNTSIKARRAMQIRRLEKELIKLNHRYEQITDPVYVSEVKGKLKSALAVGK
jgi:hypothetical protein